MSTSDDGNLFTGTFRRVPRSADAKGARAAILGIPFDLGTAPERIGARLGPTAIRQRSDYIAGRHYKSGLTDFNAIERLGLVDCGDVRLTPSDVAGAHGAIEAAVKRILDAGAIPITMGGDGAVTLPQLRALHKRHPGLVMLHIDAHTDAYPEPGITTGSTFTRVAEEELVDVRHSLHVGPRGIVRTQGVFEYCRQLGYGLITGNELLEMGLPATLARIRQVVGKRPVYMCWDMDVFDPSAAPGVCDPVWGGLTAREGIQIIEGLMGLNFVGFDVNTVSPPQDIGGQTAYLAAHVMSEFLYLACGSLGLDRGPDPAGV